MTLPSLVEYRYLLVGCCGAIVTTFTNSALKGHTSGRQNPGGGSVQGS